MPASRALYRLAGPYADTLQSRATDDADPELQLTVCAADIIVVIDTNAAVCAPPPPSLETFAETISGVVTLRFYTNA